MKKFKVWILLVCLIMCFSSVSFAAPTNFYDVKGTIYEGVVDRVASLGIINGISETTFAPNKGITRAELAKMIVFTKGLQEYADTSAMKSNFKDVRGHWAENYIAVATELELLKGYDDGTFKPDKEVSYAEVIAITLRVLGYINIDETQGDHWYFGYTKRMYEIGLDKGVPNFKNIEAPAKRGDVAIFWWNMLISERWAITSESDGSGLYYTYSSKTQLQSLFPDFLLVRGKITSIANGSSGDYIEVAIGNRLYDTDSIVPIYALGGIATGVYDTEEKVLYGLSIDDDLGEYELVAGPTFYLKDEGYKIKDSEKDAVYGSKSNANYVYLFVSKEDEKILRAVYLDASNSYYIDSVSVKNQENENEEEEDEDVVKIQDIYINENEEVFTTSESVIIKNGKKVHWDELQAGVILTELIPHRLYTYEDKVYDGEITNYEDLEELYVDNDKYIISENCVYSIYGEKSNEKDDEGKIKFHNYHKEMKKSELEKLLVRDTRFYLNVAEEISRIDFGKYIPSNIIEKYNNADSRFVYVTGVSYLPSGEDELSLRTTALDGKNYKYKITSSEDFAIGEFVRISDIEGNTAETIEKLDSDVIFEEEDMMIICEFEGEFYNDSFGEYMLGKNTLFYSINKIYKDNSNNKIESCQITQIPSLKTLGDLSKYKIKLVCNTDMEVEIVFVERELNKTTYPVARVIEIKKIETDAEEPDNADYIPNVNVKLSTISGRTNTYVMLSGECLEGELITYEAKEENEESLVIKERFKTIFLGYEQDLIIESFDKKTHIAKISNASEELNLTEYVYDFNGKEIDLLEYKYLLSNVGQDPETGEWIFKSGAFYSKEELMLEPGDRIAFGELNGIAVIYRGY